MFVEGLIGVEGEPGRMEEPPLDARVAGIAIGARKAGDAANVAFDDELLAEGNVAGRFSGRVWRICPDCWWCNRGSLATSM